MLNRWIGSALASAALLVSAGAHAARDFTPQAGTWVISEEPFFEGVRRTMNNLKLRENLVLVVTVIVLLLPLVLLGGYIAHKYQWAQTRRYSKPAMKFNSANVCV